MTPRRVRAGDVLKLERRPTEPEPAKQYVSIGIRSFGKGIFHYEPIQGDQLGKLRFFEVVPDRLVVSNIKGWEGAVALSTDTDTGCIASNRFLIYAPIDNQIDVRWARWYFLSDEGNHLLQQSSPGSADRNRTLAIGRFAALEIPLPPLQEQRRVAHHLDHLESVVAELRHRAERAAELNAALAVSIATRPDLDQATRAADGWHQIPLGDVMTPSASQVPVEPGNQYMIAGVDSFGRGLLDRGPIDGAETSYPILTKLDEGDIVVSKLNGWEGAVAVVDHDFDGYHVPSEYPTFKPDRSKLLPGSFAGIARSPGFWSDLNASARGSMVRRRRINPTEFLATRVWLPPIDLQQQTIMALATATEASRVRGQADVRVSALLPAALNQAFAALG